MLEGIKTALQSYYDTANGAKAILKQATAQIDANYRGTLYASKLKEAKDLYNGTLDESRKENYSACMAILDEVAVQARKVLETPVPTDFTAMLEALKQIKNPTKAEVESVVGAYKNNYFAYRAIYDFLDVSPKPVTIDDIDKDIAYIRDNLYMCFYSYEVETYNYRNWKDGTLVKHFDEKFRAFIEGRFEDASEEDENDVQ